MIDASHLKLLDSFTTQATSSNSTSQNGEYLQGVAVYSLGCVVINLGVNLVKLSHRWNDNLPSTEQQPARKRKFWWFGSFVFLCGNLLNFYALQFAALSLLESIGSIQFVSNIVFAWIFHKEKLTLRAGLSTACIAAGNVLMTRFLSHESKHYTVGDLQLLYQQAAYIIYISCVALATLAGLAFYSWMNRIIAAHHVKQQYVSILSEAFQPTISSPESLDSLESPILSPTVASLPAWLRRLHPFCYAVVSGLVGSQSVIFAKSLSVLIRTSFKGDNQFTSYLPYLILVAWHITMLFWLYRLNEGVAKFDALYVVPTFQMCWFLFTVLNGGIYFEEFHGFEWWRWLILSAATAVILVGVLNLSAHKSHPHPPQPEGTTSENREEEEEGDTFTALPSSPCTSGKSKPTPLKLTEVGVSTCGHHTRARSEGCCADTGGSARVGYTPPLLSTVVAGATHVCISIAHEEGVHRRRSTHSGPDLSAAFGEGGNTDITLDVGEGEGESVSVSVSVKGDESEDENETASGYISPLLDGSLNSDE